MSAEPSPAKVVQALHAAHEENDLEACLRLVAPESLDQGVRVTREEWREKWEYMRAACPDLQVTTEHTLEDGEWVANRYTARGTHTGHLFGRPPTGRPFEFRGMDMVRVRNGQLVEHWAFAEPLPGE